jgi:hypothetical protein
VENPSNAKGKTTGARQQHFSLFLRVWVTTPYGGLQEMNGVNPNQMYMYCYASALPLALLGPPLRYGRSWPAQYEFETYSTFFLFNFKCSQSKLNERIFEKI